MDEFGEVREDHCCSICLSVFCQPIKLRKCGHMFCSPCIDQTATVHAEMKRCPLCRQPFQQQEMMRDQQFEELLLKRYPHQIAERLKHIKERIYYKLEIGNTTQVLNVQSGNNYRWTLFVKPAPGEPTLDTYIDKIIVKLHPTFNPSQITFDPKKPVTLGRLGWGTFRIDITVYWKKFGHSDLYHDLQFEPKVSRIVTCKLSAE